ncbi:uncharacterized protein [Anoplolepis gracilipes]|uniref:uncharacterized protein n=1 Tax=Anoplolepis gracilipes TaxID=354296 RepID=UPI003B9F8AAC
MSKDVKRNSGAHPNYVCCSLAKDSEELESSEFSSSESITSLSELSSSASFTSCSCSDCDYSMFTNKKERKNKAIEYMQVKKRLLKRRNPSEMSTNALKKLESKKNFKGKALKVPERNKELLENIYLSDSSDDCDCNCDTYCDCKEPSSKKRQKNSKNKCGKMPSKKMGKITKTAPTCKSLKTARISKKSAMKSSKKEKTNLFDPYGCNCNMRDTKCAGSSRSSKVLKKRNAKSLSNKKVSRKRTTGSSERYSSSFSSEDSEYESFTSDKDSRDCCCGNIRQSSRRKIKH